MTKFTICITFLLQLIVSCFCYNPILDVLSEENSETESADIFNIGSNLASLGIQ